MLGHSTIQTTMRYAHLSKSALEDAVALLEPKSTIENYGQPVGNPQVFKLENSEGIRASNSEMSIFLAKDTVKNFSLK